MKKRKILSIALIPALVVSLWSTFTAAALAASTGTLTLSYEIGTEGTKQIIIAKVILSDNPGLISLRLHVNYKKEVLTLDKVENENLLKGYSAPPSPLTSPHTLRWADSLSATDNTANGLIATLFFTIVSNSSEEYGLTLGSPEAWNNSLGKIELDIVNPPSTPTTPPTTPTTPPSNNTGATDLPVVPPVVVNPAEGAIWANPFTDVKSSDWFYNDVQYAVEAGWYEGTSPTTFSPEAPMTRGQLVTVLGRYHKADVKIYSAVESSFDDVLATQYYKPYIEWAKANKIVEGLGGNKFAPEAPITRQDLAVIIARYAHFVNKRIPESKTLIAFADNDKIADYAQSAVQTLYKGELLTGMSSDTIAPLGLATRAQVAAILRRFDTKAVAASPAPTDANLEGGAL
jgi:hypothetical protein